MYNEFISTVTGFASLEYFYPMITLGIAGFILLFTGIFSGNKKLFSAIASVSLVISMLLLLIIPEVQKYVLFRSIEFNDFGLYFSILFIISALYVTIPALRNIEKKGEIFYALLLFVTTGMLVAAFSMNLIILFVAFESVSIGTYVLTGFHKTRRTLEASAKYFFTGAVSTSFIIFGLAFFFQATGTFYLLPAYNIISTQALLISLIFLTIGFGFKLAIFPMHQWAIDTYDGAENSVSAFLSTGSKLLAYMIMLKVFIIGFQYIGEDVFVLFSILAILTMTYGNLSALSQNNIKRLFAYSSVAQAGYLILVFSITSYDVWTNGSYTIVATYAVTAALIYSLIYIFMKGGAFLSMNAFKKDGPEISDLSGLSKKSPALALSLSILLLALAGIPFTGGFTGKFYMFLYLVQGKLWWLAIIAILNSAISVFYYLKVIMYMYWKKPEGEDKFIISSGTVIPVVISAIIVIVLFFSFYIFNIFYTAATALMGVF